MDGKEAFTPSSETPPGAQQSHTTVRSILALPLYQETCICRLLYRLKLEACPAFTLSMRPHVITETWRGDPTLIVLCPFRAHKLRQLRPCGNVIGQVQQDPLDMWICLPRSILCFAPPCQQSRFGTPFGTPLGAFLDPLLDQVWAHAPPTECPINVPFEPF